MVFSMSDLKTSFQVSLKSPKNLVNLVTEVNHENHLFQWMTSRATHNDQGLTNNRLAITYTLHVVN